MAHFEIHVSDGTAARDFYGNLFGWTFTAMAGGEEVDYHLVDDPGIGGNLTIGMMRRMGAAPGAGNPIRGGTMTFDVDDCDASYAWALAHGGAEALPPTDYPDIGRCAYVEDGQGNVVGMIAPEKGQD
jgi:predicted enzyme related to lactoylglutathione lyase